MSLMVLLPIFLMLASLADLVQLIRRRAKNGIIVYSFAFVFTLVLLLLRAANINFPSLLSIFMSALEILKIK